MTSSTQLSLFDTSASVATSYKVGDRVKLRKKPLAASYVKKGDIVEISAIHPLDGSIKFWNERSECWEFVHPEEIARVVDSVTSVEPAVTESTLPPGNIDSVTSVEPVVTESTLPPGNDDFLALNAISTYKPRGTARGGEYFRLSYREGGRIRHVHIRGGNTDSPIAQAKVAEVRSLLIAGITPLKIAAMLRSSSSKAPTPTLFGD